MAVHDPVSGLRVGMLTGGLLGALVTALTSVELVWLVFVLGLVGGLLGWWTERRGADAGRGSRTADRDS